MSLVGPRPHAVGMRTEGKDSMELVNEYAHRHKVKPGMTGWAQINGSRGPPILSYLPVNLANMLTAFGTIAILTRLLEPSEFGIYAIAMITMQFVHMGLFTWLEAAMQRFQARAERENDVASHLKTLYKTGLFLGVGAFSVSMVILAVVPLLFNLGMEAHKAAHRIKRYSITYSSYTLVSFTLGILFILFTPLKAAAPFVGVICGLLIVGTIDLLFMWKQMRVGIYNIEKTKTYFSYGAPICIGLLLSYALNSADVYLIAALMDEASAGEYSAGYNLANRSSILKNYGATLLWIAVPAATGIALVAKDAGFILGEGVRDNAVMIMPWIAFAGLINGLMTYYVHRGFMLSGKTHKFVWALVLPVVLNLGLNILLIPKYGLIGAVWATIISYSLAIIIATYLARQDYPLPLPLRAAFEVSGCSAIMALAVYSLPLDNMTPGFVTLMIKGMVGIGVYMLACWVANAANCRTFIRDIRGRFASRSIPEPAE